MGMFGRKRSDSGEGTVEAAAPQASAIPDYGFNQAAAFTPLNPNGLERQSSYPPDMGGRAKFTGHARTTSYQQASVYNRRTYDTIN